jgi:hypothetical protein
MMIFVAIAMALAIASLEGTVVDRRAGKIYEIFLGTHFNKAGAYNYFIFLGHFKETFAFFRSSEFLESPKYSLSFFGVLESFLGVPFQLPGSPLGVLLEFPL